MTPVRRVPVWRVPVWRVPVWRVAIRRIPVWRVAIRRAAIGAMAGALAVPLALHTSTAWAQVQASQVQAAPLPTVIYPSREPDTGPPPAAPSLSVPQTGPEAATLPPTIEYVLIDGLWGHRDRERRFHPASPALSRRLEERRRAGQASASPAPHPLRVETRPGPFPSQAGASPVHAAQPGSAPRGGCMSGVKVPPFFPC